MPELFEPGSQGFQRHSRAVRIAAGVTLVGTVAAACYATFSTGRWLYRNVMAPQDNSNEQKHSDVTVTTQPSEELQHKVVTRTWRYQRSRPSSAEPARPPSRRRRAAQPACGGKVQRSAQALMLGHWLRSTCVGAAAAGRRRGSDGLRQPCRGPRSGPSGAQPLPAPGSTQSTLPSWLGHGRLQPPTPQQLAACPPAPAPKASSRSAPMGHSLRTLAATAHPNAQPRLHPHAPPPTEGRKAGM